MTQKAPLLDAAFVARLERLRLVARRRVRGLRPGEARSLRRGAGIEPAGHRGYAPGDDFRLVDWNAYRRLGRLHVLEREAESERTHALLLDRSASMGRGGKLELGRAVVAALAWLALGAGDRVVPAVFSGGEVATGPRAQGEGQAFAVFRFLESQAAGGTTDLARACRSLARGPRRPGLAVVVSDALEEGPVRGALAALASHGREVVLLHLVAPEDEAPDLSGDQELTDAETGERLVLACDRRARREYADAFAEWVRDLEREVRSLGAVYVRARSDESLEHVTLDLLRRARVLE